MNSTTTPAIGLDIGKHSITLSVANPDQPPMKWSHQTLKLKDPDWHKQLRAIAAGAVVVLEPTGWHYARPIVYVLRNAGASIFQIPNQRTGEVRKAHVSDTKTDANDARTLALIAHWLIEGYRVRSCRHLDVEHEEAVLNLRLLVNHYQALTKQTTQLTNQLHTLAHSMWPSLSQKLKTTYWRALVLDHITPPELHAFSQRLQENGPPYPAGYAHGNARNALHRLVAITPPLQVHPTTRQRIADILPKLQATEDEITETERRISRLIHLPPFAEVTHRIMTIPAASQIAVAGVHVATHGRIHDFTVDEFKTAVGTRPNLSQSGEVTKSRQSKKGYRPVITTLWTWTMALVNPAANDNPIRDYYYPNLLKMRSKNVLLKVEKALCTPQL